MASEEFAALLDVEAGGGYGDDGAVVSAIGGSISGLPLEGMASFAHVINDFHTNEIQFDPNARFRCCFEGGCSDCAQPDVQQHSRPVRTRRLLESCIGWTPSLVVCAQHQLPDYLFTDMCLVDDAGGVVEEFEYHKEGFKRRVECPVTKRTPEGQRWKFIREEDARTSDVRLLPKIMYDITEEDEDWTGYVRVITKSSYYIDLSTELVKAMLLGVTEYSHLSFYSTLLTRPDHAKWRFGFLSALLGCLLLRFLIAVRAAGVEWRADRIAGPDLLTESLIRAEDGTKERRSVRWCMRMRIFWGSMVLFQFIGVRSLVKDLPIWLHPWKGVQPFAAFKADKARGFLLGFPDEYLFRVEDRPGMLTMYAIIALSTITITVAKLIFYFIFDEMHHSEKDAIYFLALNLAPGIVVTYSNVKGFICLIRDRHRGYKWLSRKWREGDVKQRQTMKKLIGKYYRTTPEGESSGSESSSPVKNEFGNQRPELDYMRKKSCAELVRQLQLWEAPQIFQEELRQLPEKERVSVQDAQRVLKALRRVAEKRQHQEHPCRRGPCI